MFVLKGILLGLGLFGICLAIYVVGMTRLLLKGAPTPAPGTAIGIDFVTMLRHNHWMLVALLACIMLGLSNCRLVADARRLVVLSCCCLQ
jgi:hypothetical protein